MKIKALFSVLPFIGSIPQPVVNNNTNLVLNQDEENPTDQLCRSSATQINAWHGIGWDVGVYGVIDHNIEFEQTFKRMFASDYLDELNGDYVIKSITQTTKPDLSENTGSFKFGNLNYDKDKRVQDWSLPYKDNLEVKSVNNIKWGVDDTNLYLKNTEVWPHNVGYHSINGKVVFQYGNNKAYEFQSAKDVNLNVGFNKNFNNKNFDFFGIPYSKLKECQYIYVFHNYVTRFLWSLTGQKTKNNLSLLNTQNDTPKINRYDVSDLICICEPNYSNGTITVKLNDEFIDISKKTGIRNKWFNQIDWTQYSNSIKQSMIDGINQYKIGYDNFKDIFTNVIDCNNIEQMQTYINKHISNECDLLRKYQLDINCNPYETCKYLQDFTSIKLEYEIPTKENPQKYKKEITNISNKELKEGKKINLTKNIDGNYEFKLDKLIENEYSDVNNYVGPDQKDTISVCSSFIENKNNSYILSKPFIKDASFISYYPEELAKDYPYDLTDNEVLDKFVNVTDNYNDELKGSVLDSSMYKITRDEINGRMMIDLNINDNNKQIIYGGMKKPNIKHAQFDANLFESMIYTPQLDESKIKHILDANNFDPNIVNCSNFSIDYENEEKGIANIKLCKSDNPDFYDSLKDINFEIKNLEPYYIKQNNKLSKSLSRYKPSSITKDIFINNFINTSIDFTSLNKLDIKLIPNDSKNILKAQIYYTDHFSKQDVALNFEYKFNTSKSLNKYWLLTIVGIGVLILFLGLYYYRKDCMKRSSY